MIPPSLITRHHVLSARGTNDNGTTNGNLSSAAIIIIVLVASGFLVLIGFSVTRFYFSKDEDLDRHTYRDQQMEYMHSVRRRNLESLKYTFSAKQQYHADELRSSDASLDHNGRMSRTPTYQGFST